jgi:hypothetical protein
MKTITLPVNTCAPFLYILAPHLATGDFWLQGQLLERSPVERVVPEARILSNIPKCAFSLCACTTQIGCRKTRDTPEHVAITSQNCAPTGTQKQRTPYLQKNVSMFPDCNYNTFEASLLKDDTKRSQKTPRQNVWEAIPAEVQKKRKGNSTSSMFVSLFALCPIYLDPDK